MGFVEQSKRLLWLEEGKANGNAFMGMTALTGLVGWGATVLAVHAVAPMPAGSSLGGSEMYRWSQEAMLAWKWPITFVWIAAWFGRFAWGYLRVERGSVMNPPNAIWFVASLAAFATNLYAVVVTAPEILWLSWFGVFVVGYLSTAFLVERARVYWVAGILSTLGFAYGVYAIVTNTGYAVVGPASQLPPEVVATVGANTVLMPLPFTYVILGLLHVVPMAIDAHLGGRQLTESEIPAVRADESDDETAAGGVIPSD